MESGRVGNESSSSGSSWTRTGLPGPSSSPSSVVVVVASSFT